LNFERGQIKIAVQTLISNPVFRVGVVVGYRMAVINSRDEVPTASDTVSATENVETKTHPLASISGLLERHPLRDEYLEALGITE
jgi:hypothetical protein